MPARTYSARVMKFRRGVYANRRTLTGGCTVLLLRLSDDMDAKAIVSVPRSKLAAELDAPTSRISEWTAEAKKLGFLSTVRRGRPGVTAVYQGLEVRPGVPSTRYGFLDHEGVRPGVPPESPAWYAPACTQENTGTAANGTVGGTHRRDVGNDDEQARPSVVASLTATTVNGDKR